MTHGSEEHDGYLWHDDTIYALHFDAPDPDRGVWRSDLVLDIDHIVEWIRGASGRIEFRVAPATLVFHDVDDLRIDLDFAQGLFRGSLNELSIDTITRVTAPSTTPQASVPRYLWRIGLSLPPNGEISFGASGFSQVLRADPVQIAEQRLPASTRPHLLRFREPTI